MGDANRYSQLASFNCNCTACAEIIWQHGLQRSSSQSRLTSTCQLCNVLMSVAYNIREQCPTVIWLCWQNCRLSVTHAWLILPTLTDSTKTPWTDGVILLSHMCPSMPCWQSSALLISHTTACTRCILPGLWSLYWQWKWPHGNRGSGFWLRVMAFCDR